jgi:hypothetical protein
VHTSYTRRGAVRQVGSTYGPLVHHVRRNAEGLTEQVQCGDLARTTTAFGYDALRRVRDATTFRAKPPEWGGPGTTPDEKYSRQLLLQDEQLSYDRVGTGTRPFSAPTRSSDAWRPKSRRNASSWGDPTPAS